MVRVIHVYQVQSACRSRGPSLIAGASSEDGLNFCFCTISSTYFEKGSYQVPHHVMEETVAAHPIEKQIGLFRPLRSMEAAHVAGRIGVGGGKGGEVVLAQNHPGASLHGIDIQPLMQRIYVTCLPGRANLSPKNFV